jgi:hypothetical protein
MCRKAHGAGFATYADVARSQVDIEDAQGALRHHRSSTKVSRSFCSICGSSLFWESDEAPKLLGIAVGTLDAELLRAPDAHIFVASKASWVEIIGSLPQHAEAPTIDQTLSATIPLSPKTRAHMEVSFREPEREQAEKLLVESCGGNLPLWEEPTPESLERIRFAALKISRGEIARLEEAVLLATTDWRDLLVLAGFADDLGAHESWSPEVSSAS